MCREGLNLLSVVYNKIVFALEFPRDKSPYIDTTCYDMIILKSKRFNRLDRYNGKINDNIMIIILSYIRLSSYV